MKSWSKLKHLQQAWLDLFRRHNIALSLGVKQEGIAKSRCLCNIIYTIASPFGAKRSESHEIKLLNTRRILQKLPKEESGLK